MRATRMIQLLFYILSRTQQMTELEKLLLEKVSQLEDKIETLEKENRRLEKIVDKLHADCYYYENHREPKQTFVLKRIEESNFPF